MRSNRKADYTPEEWEKYLEAARAYRRANAERYREQRREYAQRPEVKARRKKREETPEAAERRRVFNKSPEAKARRKAAHVRLRLNPEAWTKRIDKQRRARTGLGQAEVQQLLELQGNRCGICDRSFDGRQVRADHCHDSNVPRGLLCHHCNIIEGMLRGMKLTPEEFAVRMRAYLDHPPVLLLSR